MPTDKKDKVGKGKGGRAATSLNKTIRGGARKFVDVVTGVVGKGPKKKK